MNTMELLPVVSNKAMTMKELLNLYCDNLLKAIQEHKVSTEDLGMRCQLCPLREACRAASEQGDDMTCGEFIRSQLSDGTEYRA